MNNENKDINNENKDINDENVSINKENIDMNNKIEVQEINDENESIEKEVPETKVDDVSVSSELDDLEVVDVSAVNVINEMKAEVENADREVNNEEVESQNMDNDVTEVNAEAETVENEVNDKEPESLNLEDEMAEVKVETGNAENKVNDEEAEPQNIENDATEDGDESKNIGTKEDIDLDNIKIEEIDLDAVRKELEEEKYDKQKLERELEVLEKNILKQSDIFETDIILDAILKEENLISQTAMLNQKKINEAADSNELKVNNGIKLNKKKKTHNKAMSKVLVAVTSVFMALIIYIIYFVMIDSQSKLNNEYNERSLLLEETVVRGNIYSSDNRILAQTIEEDGEWIRNYPYGSMFAHTVGRYEKGKTGIELGSDFSLVTTKDSVLDKILNDINDEKSMGNSIVTTLDFDLQKIAYDALGNKKGAVVAIEPKTGKIIAMVSKPSYDPNFVTKNWSVLSNTDNTRNSLINRATSGLYPPGSTFKIVTVLAYMRNQSAGTYSYQCKGTHNFNGFNMQCYDKKVHGPLDIVSAFANSCNGAFGNMGTIIGAKNMNKIAKDLMFNKELDFDYGYSISKFDLGASADETLLAQTAIGQGDTRITPFQNALLVSGIANGGDVMKPYMVDKLVDGDGRAIEITKQKKMKSIMSNKEATFLKELMRNVVDNGTAMGLKDLDVEVAGKTGSAEYNDEGDSHSWFVGFAPADNPSIAVSIIVENGGTGSESAVPIAGRMINGYFNK